MNTVKVIVVREQWLEETLFAYTTVIQKPKARALALTLRMTGAVEADKDLSIDDIHVMAIRVTDNQRALAVIKSVIHYET